jgi:hypothetical protein
MCGGVVGDIGESIDKAVTQPIGKGLSEVDTFVNREIPGGWVTVGLTAAGAAAYVAAADAAVATGATLAEAEAAGAVAAASAEAAEAAALAEGGVTAGMAGAANTGLPVGTQTLGGTVAASGGAPIFDFSTEATLTPGGNVVPATTLPSEMAAIDAQIASAGAEAAKALPTKISPFQAIQGARMATGLLGGGQQQQAQALPQMGGVQQRMPQGAVDYSGIYNLLALQRARNPNSLLG